MEAQRERGDAQQSSNSCKATHLVRQRSASKQCCRIDESKDVKHLKAPETEACMPLSQHILIQKNLFRHTRVHDIIFCGHCKLLGHHPPALHRHEPAQICDEASGAQVGYSYNPRC